MSLIYEFCFQDNEIIGSKGQGAGLGSARGEIFEPAVYFQVLSFSEQIAKISSSSWSGSQYEISVIRSLMFFFAITDLVFEIKLPQHGEILSSPLPLSDSVLLSLSDSVLLKLPDSVLSTGGGGSVCSGQVLKRFK